MTVTEFADVDLGSLVFWGRPAEARDEYFAHLRRAEPISRRPRDARGLPVVPGHGRPAPHQAARPGLRGVHATPDQPHRGRRPRQRQAIVAEAATTGGGDFVDLIAKRLPLQTISDMLGVPESDRDRVVEAADTLIMAADPDCFGDRLTHPEIAAFLVLLSVAGNDTTRHTTSHAMRALTLHPDQRQTLLEGLDARLPDAVEEFIRWATPVLTFRRTTTREVELHGQALPAGEKVVLF